MKKIDKEYLLANNWEEGELLSVPGFGDFIDYTYNYNDQFYFTITFGYCNSDRNASLHIDNKSFETIANADIDTTEHFNLMMKVIDCDYELN